MRRVCLFRVYRWLRGNGVYETDTLQHIWGVRDRYTPTYMGCTRQIHSNIYGVYETETLQHIWGVRDRYTPTYMGCTRQIHSNIYGVYETDTLQHIWGVRDRYTPTYMGCTRQIHSNIYGVYETDTLQHILYGDFLVVLLNASLHRSIIGWVCIFASYI